MPQRNIFARLYRPDPAPPAFSNGRVLPQVTASFASLLFFHWVSPLLSVGYTRPLEKEDLWTLDESRRASHVTEQVSREFKSRCEAEGIVLGPAPAEMESQSLKSPKVDGENPLETTLPPSQEGDGSKTPPPKKLSPLVLAVNACYWKSFWTAGIFLLITIVSQTVIPLLSKKLLTYLTLAYYHQKDPESIPPPQSVGYGLGWAFGIFGLQLLQSFCNQHHLQRTMSIGMQARSAITGMIFAKALKLNHRARAIHSTGKITTMISSDVQRIEGAMSYAHFAWTGPIQLVLGIGLLIDTLGYSALAGLALILLAFPFQGIFIYFLFTTRAKTVAIMDKRVRLLQEVLGGIRVIKLFAWEPHFASKINMLRRAELKQVRRGLVALCGLIATVGVVPVLASIISFIVYSLTGHPLNPAIIFTSLQYFNVIRVPILLIPVIMSSLADALVAIQRIEPFLLAEELAEPYTYDPDAPYAVHAEGDFIWDSDPQATSKEDEKKGEGKNKDAKGKKATKKKGKEEPALPLTEMQIGSDNTATVTEVPREPFQLRDLNITIQRGAFVTIVGKVGSGKSSLLQALIGEMRRARGETIVSAPVAYLPQLPWILNTTVRENILFGEEYDEGRYDRAVASCQLLPDLAILPFGDMTEIGEKGVALSGGTKARVSLARAAYSKTDIVILDDTLSAVDSHVGKAILNRCLLDGPFADRTRIMVTHAMHVVPHSDYVYLIEDGRIAEQGTYEELMTKQSGFNELVASLSDEQQKQKTRTRRVASEGADPTTGKKGDEPTTTMMQMEERNTGAVEFSVYKKYLRAGGGLAWAPVIFGFLLLNEASSVVTSLWLGYWSGQTIHGFTQGEYMAVYAGLGVAQAFASFFAGASIALVGLLAGLSLFSQAFSSVLRAPMSFFDTSPLGRIVSRLSTDIDVIDSQMGPAFYMLFTTAFNVIGNVFLVFYTFPLLGIIFVPMSILYYVSSIFYRRTSVEVKRLESILRSKLFTAYSEALTGLATIRASHRQDSFTASVTGGLDYQNQAHYMTIVLKNWLSIRLEMFGNILILGISLFAVGMRTSVYPAKTGVVLSYSLGITYVLSEMVTQFASVEQNMNTVERVQHYADALPQEEAAEVPEDASLLREGWPKNGAIRFRDVEMRYRDNLPVILKGVSFDIKSGEKVGCVGRTGSGKSSLIQALFRVVELQNGSISIDDVDIHTVGLGTLRHHVAVIPQDVKLFYGTLRENLDPLSQKTDAELLEIMRFANVRSTPGSQTPEDVAAGSSPELNVPTTSLSRFDLDMAVEHEGSNFSAGEAQLIALGRALVKGSRVVVMDEATSSIDPVTDAHIQEVVASSSCTLFTIAHRLNTVAYYDRILVVDEGQAAEFDEPLRLFDQPGSIFRLLCNEAALSREELVRIRTKISTS